MSVQKHCLDREKKKRRRRINTVAKLFALHTNSASRKWQFNRLYSEPVTLLRENWNKDNEIYIEMKCVSADVTVCSGKFE